MLDLRQAWHPCARAPSSSAAVVNPADSLCTALASMQGAELAPALPSVFSSVHSMPPRPSDHGMPAVLAAWHRKCNAYSGSRPSSCLAVPRCEQTTCWGLRIVQGSKHPGVCMHACMGGWGRAFKAGEHVMAAGRLDKG